MATKMRRVSIYLPEAMAVFFQKYAHHRGISLSKAIRDCLDGVLAFLDDSRVSMDGIEEQRRFEELLRKAKAEGRLIHQ